MSPLCRHFIIASVVASLGTASALSEPPRPQAATPPRTDRLGDPLPPGAVIRLGTKRFRHIDGSIDHLSFSRDGRQIISAARDGILAWDATSGRQLRRFAEYGYDFVLSPDGSTLAKAGAFATELLSVETQESVGRIDIGRQHVTELGFSAEGKVIHTFGYAKQGDPFEVIRWDVATAAKIGGWKTDASGRAAFSADGALIATLSDQATTVRIWETASGKKLHEWKGEGKTQVGALTFSPDGRVLAVGAEQGMIRLYDTVGGKEIRKWKARLPDDIPEGWYEVTSKVTITDSSCVDHLRFAPDGKLLASLDADDVLRLWDWSTGRQLRRFADVYGPVAFSRDGKRLAAGGVRGRVRLWEVATGRDLCPQQPHPGNFTRAIFSPDGRLLAAGSDRGMVYLVEVGGGREMCRFPAHEPAMFSPDGRSLLLRWSRGAPEGALALYSLATGKELVRIRGTEPADKLCWWLNGGKSILTAGWWDQRRVCVWDGGTGNKRHESLAGGEDCSISVSADGRIAAIHDVPHATIRLLTFPRAKELRRLTGCDPRGMYDVSRKDPDNGGLIGSRGGTISVPTALSGDGRLLFAGAGENTLAMWHVASGKQVCRFGLKEFYPGGPIFTPDGKSLILLDHHGDPCFIDTETGRVRRRLIWQGGKLECILRSDRCLSPDGRLLAVRYDEQTMVLWELATGQPMGTWPGHGRGALQQVEIAPDGRTMVTVGEDGTALAWDLTGLSPDGRLPALKHTPEELAAAWDDLGRPDAEKAHRRLWSLVAAPRQAVPYLCERLRPVAKPDARRLGQWIDELDSPQFAVRQQAAKELERLGELAEPALRQALAQKRSLEQRRRIERILEPIAAETVPAELLRGVRAIEVLEHIGNADARQALRALAGGAAEARLTREAKAALERLARRPTAPN